MIADTSLTKQWHCHFEYAGLIVGTLSCHRAS